MPTFYFRFLCENNISIIPILLSTTKAYDPIFYYVIYLLIHTDDLIASILEIVDLHLHLV